MSKKLNRARFVLELRNIALVVTRENKIAVKYSKRAPTACINMRNYHITVTPKLLPKGLEKHPILWKYAFHGQVLHEALHYNLTLPIEGRYERFVKRQKYPKLAHEVTNIIEDKRINDFGIKRYRFDLGKRLEFLMDLIKRTSETAMQKKLATNFGAKSTISLIMGAFVQKGLYDCDIAHIKKALKFKEDLAKKNKNPNKDFKPLEDLEELLSLLEEHKYSHVKWQLINCAKTMYDIIEKYTKRDFSGKDGDYIPIWVEGGKLGGEFDEALEDELEKKEKSEEKEEEEDEDYSEGYGAGKGTGDEIPAPKPNFEAYQQLVSENSPEIQKLLNKLKRTVKPVVKRELFRKRGRIMAPIVPKAYVSSLRRRVQKIYISKSVHYEKEKVAMAILVDFSGSMNKHTAQCVLTILNEVFGQWLEDKAFCVQVFGADRQKIKTFYEQFNNTRHRIGGISVNAGGTNISQSLEDVLRQFQGLETERRRILVVASDFCFGDSTKADEGFLKLIKANVKLLFVGLCCYNDMPSCLPNERQIERVSVDNVEDLPDLFTEVYIKSIMNEGRSRQT